ncbi:MAG: hypothetical protein EZS28_011635 [Streblomastix strix]|uniref:Right handed beta helix domain-containing protein n=1 Tax=Streblomastix strix TaxID=222440 RepID=A0A5J4WDR4_9EUKA|nr:MAG: hypothetical protein EZS28_011635 [Streblomastix strix]
MISNNVQSSSQFDTCASINGKGGAGYFVLKDKGAVEVNQAIFKTCNSINGGGLYISLDNSSSLTITNSNLFSGCTTSESGGGLYAYVKDTDSKMLIEDNSYFYECISSNDQGGAGYIEGLLFSCIEINKAKIEKCNSIQGKGIYFNIKTKAQLQATNSCLFKGCTSSQSGGCFYAIINGADSKLNISDFTLFDSYLITSPTGQGGGSYLRIIKDATYELNKVIYKGYNAVEGGIMYGGHILFKENTAGEYGRDIFFLCSSLNFLDISHHLLFDQFCPLYDLDNAIYGTEYWTQTELSREPEVDYDPTQRYTSFLVTHFIYRTKTLTSEANELILRGATHDEVDSISVGYHSKVQFGAYGQIICQDLAQWQEEENEFSDVNGVNQKFTLEFLDFVLPEQMEEAGKLNYSFQTARYDFKRF